MKKKIAILAVLAILVASVAVGSLAYYTHEDTVINTITSGGVTIRLVEQTLQGDALVDFPAGGISGVMPGSSVSKIVTVENQGSEAWVRILVETAVTDGEGGELPADVMSFDIGADWHLGADGYYYYTLPVAQGESTQPLFEHVTFSTDMGNEYQNCTVNITVSAQAVQTANNGAAYQDAQGWPEA